MLAYGLLVPVQGMHCMDVMFIMIPVTCQDNAKLLYCDWATVMLQTEHHMASLQQQAQACTTVADMASLCVLLRVQDQHTSMSSASVSRPEN